MCACVCVRVYILNCKFSNIKIAYLVTGGVIFQYRKVVYPRDHQHPIGINILFAGVFFDVVFGQVHHGVRSRFLSRVRDGSFAVVCMIVRLAVFCAVAISPERS